MNYITQIKAQLKADNKPNFQVEHFDKWLEYMNLEDNIHAFNYYTVLTQVESYYHFSPLSEKMKKIFNCWINNEELL